MPRKLTTDDFLEKAKTKASPSLDLSLVEYVTARIPVDVICRKHDLVFAMNPNKILNGQNGCPDCSGKRLTTADFIRRAQGAHGKTKFNYSKTEYRKMGEKLSVICTKHDNEFHQIAQAHLNGFNGCHECNGQTKITPDDFVVRAERVFENKKFDYSERPEQFDSIHMRVHIRCIEHNEWFQQAAWSHLNGKIGCHECNPQASISKKKFFQRVSEVFSENKYDYSLLEFSNNGLASIRNRIISIICKEHGVFLQNVNNHIVGKEGCKECATRDRLTTVEEFIERSKSIHGTNKYSGYENLKLQHGLQGEVELECLEHGKFSYSIFHHLQGHEGCVPCRRVGTSKAEQSLYDYVCNLLPNYEVQRSNRGVLGQKELDIYIPEKHLAIEYNGVYWHSERFGKDKWYHYNKWAECKQQGIQLLTIWEDDYARNPELIKLMIAHKLVVSSVHRMPARKTTFEKVNQEDAANFLEKHHLQGSHKTSRHFGLRDSADNELIAVMSTRYSASKQELEIIRFATSMTVQGGFTKLLTNILKQPEFSDVGKVISYSHNDHSDGGLYENNGFERVHYGTPGYYYLRAGKINREHRLNYSPKRFREHTDLLYEEGLSERELATLNGLERVWDCGSSLWAKKL